MPPPSAWERVAPPEPGSEPLPPWGRLVLEGAARGWMIFAIVWGSVLFVIQDVSQNIGRHNNPNNNSQVLGAHRGPATTTEGRTGLP